MSSYKCLLSKFFKDLFILQCLFPMKLVENISFHSFSLRAERKVDANRTLIIVGRVIKA